MGQDQHNENKSRYDVAVETLLNESITVLESIDFKSYDKSLLIIAVSAINDKSVKHILTKYPDTTVQNKDGKTALILAYDSANELHESRSVWSDQDELTRFKEVKQRRAQSLNIIRLLGGDTSLFDVYIH